MMDGWDIVKIMNSGKKQFMDTHISVQAIVHEKATPDQEGKLNRLQTVISLIKMAVDVISRVLVEIPPRASIQS